MSTAMDSDDDSDATQLCLWIPDYEPFETAAANEPMYMDADRYKAYLARQEVFRRRRRRALKGLILYRGYGLERTEDGRILRSRRPKRSRYDVKIERLR